MKNTFGIEVGDIFAERYGNEPYYTTFYQVVEIPSPHFVDVRRIGSKSRGINRQDRLQDRACVPLQWGIPVDSGIYADMERPVPSCRRAGRLTKRQVSMRLDFRRYRYACMRRRLTANATTQHATAVGTANWATSTPV